MNNSQLSQLIFLIGLCIALLSSCAFPARKFLAADASIIQKGQTKSEVIELIGIPDAVRQNPEDREEWYYFDERKRFWQYIPLIRHIGKLEIQGIQIVFESDKVTKVVYYVQYQ